MIYKWLNIDKMFATWNNILIKQILSFSKHIVKFHPRFIIINTFLYVNMMYLKWFHGIFTLRDYTNAHWIRFFIAPAFFFCVLKQSIFFCWIIFVKVELHRLLTDVLGRFISRVSENSVKEFCRFLS